MENGYTETIMIATVREKNSKGHASILFLFFAAAIMLGVYSFYDTGQVASERIRLQNTADNTAYSMANLITREMNLLAISNRAMASNQVVIAQLLALASWAGMVDQFAGRLETIGDVARFIPYVGPFIEKATEAIKTGAEKLNEVIKTIGSYGITAHDWWMLGLYKLQDAIHGATLVQAQSVFSDTLKRNDPGAKTSPLVAGFNVASFVKTWQNKTSRFNIDNVAKRRHDKTGQRFVEFSNVVNDSRDRFSAQRSYDFFKFSLPFPLATGAGPVLGIPGAAYWSKFWASRRGGTDFTLKRKNRKYRWNWTSADTFSFWIDVKYLKPCWKVVCKKRKVDEIYKLGWGGAHALQKQVSNSRGFYDYESRRRVTEQTEANSSWNQLNGKSTRSLAAWGGAWNNRGSADNLDERVITNTREPDAYNNLTDVDGIKSFYDLRNDDKTNYGSSFSLIIQKPSSQVSSQKVMDDRNNNYKRSERFTIESEGGIPKNSLFALATARPEFSRADESLRKGKGKWVVKWGRKDGLHEYGNLYNPFWETKLIAKDHNLLNLIFSS